MPSVHAPRENALASWLAADCALRLASRPPNSKRRSKARHLKRLTTLAELANAAAFLASDHASAMTGTVANLAFRRKNGAEAEAEAEAEIDESCIRACPVRASGRK